MPSSSNRDVGIIKKGKTTAAVSCIALCVFIAGMLYVSYCMAIASSVMRDVREAMSGSPHELECSSDLSPIARYFGPVAVGEDEPIVHYVTNADCYFVVVGVAHGRMWLHTEITTKDANGVASNASNDCVELCIERTGDEWRVMDLEWKP